MQVNSAPALAACSRRRAVDVAENIRLQYLYNDFPSPGTTSSLFSLADIILIITIVVISEAKFFQEPGSVLVLILILCSAELLFFTVQ